MAHIIIADDDDLVLEVVRDAFETYGHTIGTVSDGQQALNAIVAKNPDLVILDCDMPDYPGISTLEVLRKDPRYHRLPVIMLTESRSNKDISIFAGANAYVTKPFEPDFLVFRAEELIEKSIAGSRPVGSD